MNDLIKVTYNSDRPTTSARELWEFLEEKATFEEFFIAVSTIKIYAQREFLKALRDEVQKFSLKFGSEAITLLCDSITAEMVLPCSNVPEKTLSESDYKKYIVKNFSHLFPSYQYVGQEIEVEGIGRIDILAKHKETNQAVIIELKISNFNPNKQLIAYGSKYNNPILIGITEMSLPDEKKINNIIYFTYEELMGPTEMKAIN